MSDGMRMGGPPMGGGARPGAAPRPPMGGGMPPGGQQGPRPGTSNMSMFNPTDLAAKSAMGDINPNMTVGEFLQKNFGVSPNDPVQKLMEATKSQLQTKDMAGKLGVQPQGGAVPRQPAAPPRPPASPMGGGGMSPQRQPAPSGLDSLVSKL